MHAEAAAMGSDFTDDGRLVPTWRGRSGRPYALDPLRLDSFRLVGDSLYLIAIGKHVLWVGSADELVADPQSRARFRLAMDCADRAYRIAGSFDPVARMTVVWDLEGAEPAPPAREAA
jgi:hypothetical protein